MSLLSKQDGIYKADGYSISRQAQEALLHSSPSIDDGNAPHNKLTQPCQLEETTSGHHVSRSTTSLCSRETMSLTPLAICETACSLTNKA
ncbi:hypothetical protein MA16_Dca002157 [Dendrobium catenatum]|uniref:Uncharacterized protein n=1 Tax=Dendrobium catenatum TaxID=906689 RepID=A0A2I0XEJ0_9ASPA|nr:hypothetical protein MA16_Dca002157 [Dendrobium catenatum]